MNVRLVKEYRFEAAHRLTRVSDQHPCGRMHGHSYRVELALEGAVDPAVGWLIDFGEIDGAWVPLKKRLDHAVLNDLPGLDNPTSENLTRWIWDELVTALPMLSRVTLWETADARCEYEGKSDQDSSHKA
jgi:6-pyruvoyltetrahydropterin/6-carboxytetrahydropterin synthase